MWWESTQMPEKGFENRNQSSSWTRHAFSVRRTRKEGEKEEKKEERKEGRRGRRGRRGLSASANTFARSNECHHSFDVRVQVRRKGDCKQVSEMHERWNDERRQIGFDERILNSRTRSIGENKEKLEQVDKCWYFLMGQDCNWNFVWQRDEPKEKDYGGWCMHRRRLSPETTCVQHLVVWRRPILKKRFCTKTLRYVITSKSTDLRILKLF